jgi:hypothetical protein
MILEKRHPKNQRFTSFEFSFAEDEGDSDDRMESNSRQDSRSYLTFYVNLVPTNPNLPT